MDRTLVFAASAPIPVGHRIEVAEQLDVESGTSAVVAITDLDTGIRYQRAEEPTGEVAIWQGSILATTITTTADGPRTAVRVDVARSAFADGTLDADEALRGADAAADAARAEAYRWGGSDRPPPEEPVRIW